MLSPHAIAPARRRLHAVALIAFFAVSLALFLQHNRHPFYYHPDEWGKCRQIVDGRRNFNHPLLMLNVAQPLKRFWGKDPGESKPVQFQKAVEAGRTASAIFAALTVAALVIAGYVIGGWAAAVATGVVVLLNPFLFEHAHIFKEDTALTMGLALTCMAAALFWKRPNCTRRTILLGIAVALAVSGKYVGFTALLIALPVIVFAPGERRRRLAICAAVFALTFIVVNWQMFAHLGEWRESFNRELGYSMKGHRGVIAEDSVGNYLALFRFTVPMAAVIFLMLNFWNLVTTARRRSVADWLIFLFPFALTALLMTSLRVSGRYFLPAAVLFNFNAAAGIGLSGEWLTRALGRFRHAGQLVFVALAVYFGWGGEIAKFRETYAQFQVDDRRDLERWMNDNLPAGSLVAQDSQVGLPDPEHHKQRGMNRAFNHKVLGSEFVPDVGTLDELRAKGVRYIATTPKKSDRYTTGGFVPSDDMKDEFVRRKTFYSALPQQAKIIWHRPLLDIDDLHPGIDLYDLGAKP